MAYSTLDEIQTELGEKELIRLTDSENSVVDTSKVNFAISYADLLIDAYLSGVYITPLNTPTDGIIRKISKDLAVNNLYEAAYSKTAVPNTIVWKKIDAIKLLKDIRNGIIKIDAVTNGASLPVIITNKDIY